MSNIKGLFVLCIIYSNGNGFLLPKRNISTSQQTVAFISNQDVIDVLNFLGEELRQMRQNWTGQEFKRQQENRALEQEIANLTQQDVKLQQENQALKQEIANLTQQGVECQLEYQALKQDIIHLKQDTANLQQQDVKLQMENANLTQRVVYTDGLIANISANKNIRVAFSAKLPGPTSTTSSGLNFSTIISNIGGGYNGSDGVFYCPKAGLYLFSVTVMGYMGTYVLAYIMKNTNQIALLAENGSGNSYQTASLTLALNLRTGDRIWIKGGGIRYAQYSYFTGILIK